MCICITWMYSVSLFIAIKEVLGVVIPRMKEFHDLLVRPPNVSWCMHVYISICTNMHVHV